MLVNQVAQLPYQAAAFRWRHLAPWTFVKSLAGSLHRKVDIGAIAFRNLRQYFTRRRIISGESLSRNCVNPLAVDEHFARLLNKAEHARIDLCGGNRSHRNLQNSGLKRSFGERSDAPRSC